MGLRPSIPRTDWSSNVEFAGLAAEFCSRYAYGVITNGGLSVTIRIISLGICENGAAEVTINGEGGGFRGIVEEPNESSRAVLCNGEGTENKPDQKQRGHSHTNQLPRAILIVRHYKGWLA